MKILDIFFGKRMSLFEGVCFGLALIINDKFDTYWGLALLFASQIIAGFVQEYIRIKAIKK